MLLSKLTPIVLYSLTSFRGSDGDIIEEYEDILHTKGAIQYLASDELAQSAYGANLDKTYRFKSIYGDVERLLMEKTNNSPDNLTKYLVEWKGNKYAVVKVTPLYIDIQWR